jgi:hypothetical protein
VKGIKGWIYLYNVMITRQEDMMKHYYAEKITNNHPFNYSLIFSVLILLFSVHYLIPARQKKHPRGTLILGKQKI